MSAAAPTRTVSILKMGFAEPELLAKYGDYVDMVRRKLPASEQATAQVIDPLTGALPDPKSIDRLIITGSSSMVTDPTPTDLQAFN